MSYILYNLFLTAYICMYTFEIDMFYVILTVQHVRTTVHQLHDSTLMYFPYHTLAI